MLLASRVWWTLAATRLATVTETELLGNGRLGMPGETSQESTHQAAKKPSPRCVCREALGEIVEFLAIHHRFAPSSGALWVLSTGHPARRSPAEGETGETPHLAPWSSN